MLHVCVSGGVCVRVAVVGCFVAACYFVAALEVAVPAACHLATVALTQPLAVRHVAERDDTAISFAYDVCELRLVNGRGAAVSIHAVVMLGAHRGVFGAWRHTASIHRACAVNDLLRLDQRAPVDLSLVVQVAHAER